MRQPTVSAMSLSDAPLQDGFLGCECLPHVCSTRWYKWMRITCGARCGRGNKVPRCDPGQCRDDTRNLPGIAARVSDLGGTDEGTGASCDRHDEPGNDRRS